jgi:hypothetical protein
MASRRLLVVSASILALAFSGLGQTLSHTFQLTHVSSAASMNEIATILKTLDNDQTFADLEKQEMTVTGTANQIAFAEWVIEHLDVATPPAGTLQYTATGSDTPTARIYYLANTPGQYPLNELVTNLRAVGNIQRIFTYSALHAIVIRATPAAAQFGDWLVHQMDVSPTHPAGTAQYEIPTGRCGNGLAETAFLKYPRSQSGLNEMVTTIRTVADVQMIFTHSSAPQGIAFRGCTSNVNLADWLFHQIDAQPDAQARAQKHEYVIPDSPDSVARVYYLNTRETQALNQLVNSIRSEAQLTRIFDCLETGTLALRAAPDLMSVADRIIRERDQ